MADDLELIRKRAADIGLTNLTVADLQQLAKADAGARKRLGRLPSDLHMYEEPAHVFRLDEEV